MCRTNATQGTKDSKKGIRYVNFLVAKIFAKINDNLAAEKLLTTLMGLGSLGKFQ